MTKTKTPEGFSALMEYIGVTVPKKLTGAKKHEIITAAMSTHGQMVAMNLMEKGITIESDNFAIMKAANEYKAGSTGTIADALVILGFNIEPKSELAALLKKRAENAPDRYSHEFVGNLRDNAIRHTQKAIDLSFINTIPLENKAEVTNSQKRQTRPNKLERT